MKNIDLVTVNNLELAAEKLSFDIHKNYRLNMWGVRTPRGEFNDFFIFWRYSDKGELGVHGPFLGTTEPGQGWLAQVVGNPNGTFVLRHDKQYKNAFQYGWHKGKYPAGVQSDVAQFEGWRDKNKNGVVDYEGPIYKDVRGCNFHRTKQGYIRDFIGQFSAGCQVMFDTDKYEMEVFPELAMDFIVFKYVDYTLIHIDTLKRCLNLTQ